jgi:KipI family sensor histidine kinase inhibitor
MTKPKLHLLNEKTLLVQWQEDCSLELLRRIKAIETLLLEEVENIEETQVVYNSLCLHWQNPIEDEEMQAVRTSIANRKGHSDQLPMLWKIPVCYDQEFGPDLQSCASKLQLNADQLIERHTAFVYPVYGIGFLPGFLYLGDVPRDLQVSRRSEPRLQVAQGSVGLAGQQTGIYPQQSPGGWQLLGRTPVKLFDIRQSPPCRIQVGDGVQFYAIDKPTYSLMEIQIQEEIYSLESEEWR